LLVLMAGANLCTPLFPIYARVYHLSPLMVTLLFATCGLSVIPALLVFGPLADAKGRREVLLVAILAAVVGNALFVAARGVAWLFAAQLMQGMALAALQAAAAPTLIEHDPSGRRRWASATASTLTVVGAALGPLSAGLLAQYAPWPTRLTYLVQFVLLAAILTAVVSCLPARADRAPWRPTRPGVPVEIRRPFALAGLSTLLAWGVAGLFMSLIPSFVSGVLDDHNLAAGGAVVALFLGSAGAVQPAGRRLPSLRAQIIGLLAMSGGLVLLLAADETRGAALLLAATMLGGLGQGLAFLGSLGDVTEAAPQNRRSDVVAAFYVVVYLGTAIPAIGVGVLARYGGLRAAVGVFAVAMLAGALAAVGALVTEERNRRRTFTGHAPVLARLPA
jgi:MFS family permease